MKKNIVFICTANMCRSPMAEYMLRARLPKDGVWQVSSAGTVASDGGEGSANSVDVLREVGIDMSEHRARVLTPDIVSSASVIIVMTQAHCKDVLDIVPDSEEKIFLLRSFDPHADTRDVPDPVGWDVDVYRGTREMIDSALSGIIEFLDQLEGI